MQNAFDRQSTLQHERLDAYAVAVELDAVLTLMAHRGACRVAERGSAKGLTVPVVAMLKALRNRAAP